MNRKYNYLNWITALSFILLTSCARDIDELKPASFPKTPEVFIDGFSGGLKYAAFGGSKVTAFDVDTEVAYDGQASMKFAVPDQGDPAGAYAGGVFFTDVGRDLSGYDALTFWVRASKSANIDLLGFGNDLGEERYKVSLTNVAVNTNWRKIVIPIPNPDVLVEERGMLFYSEAPEDEKGYTFWIDEVQFEKLGTLAHPKASILAGQDQVILAETGDKLTVGSNTFTVNLPSGIDQTVDITAAYFDFTSSNTSVASIDETGSISVLDQGDAVVTAKLAGVDAEGSMTITSSGAAIRPTGPAPTPMVSPDSVISMFSNAYTDVVVDTWNPFWEFSTTLLEDIKIGDDDVKRYKQLNFVGILTESEQIDATEMTHFHIDIWTPDATAPPAAFKVLLVDFGADGNFDGGDDSSQELAFTSPQLQTEEWISLDIPLSDFTGLTNRKNLAQLVLSGDLPNVFVDNVYFYNSGSSTGGGSNQPMSAAPTPSEAAADVISLYSNTYTNEAIDTWSADWDQADVADVQVFGDDAKLYTGLAFAGVEFTSQPIDISAMERFHMDIWTPDATGLPAVFKIKLVDFGPDGSFEGGDDTEHEITLDANAGLASQTWVGIDLPLSDFTGLTTKGSLAQLVISGDPNTVYVDNVYFYKGDGGGGNNPTDPTAAAPDPTQNEADVISLFSDVYTDVTVDTWRTEWSSATFEDVMVAGNATKKYSALDFVGIETVANTIDISDMTHIHLDVWSSNFTYFAIKLVDFGADGAFDGGDDVEHEIQFMAPAQGTWVGYDILISDFTGLTTKSNMAQYILVAQPSEGATVYVDNMYFYK
ncbi:MAG: carbohydrate binding domain-containing protein [Bacteroidota bacterium]